MYDTFSYNYNITFQSGKITHITILQFKFGDENQRNPNNTLMHKIKFLQKEPMTIFLTAGDMTGENDTSFAYYCN